MKDDRHMAPAWITRWFESQDWRPLPFQQRCWSAHGQGKSGLIVAPTGIGKTYAAWLGPVMRWMESGEATDDPPPLTVLWLTPLRALATDTCDALRLPIEQLELPWTDPIRWLSRINRWSCFPSTCFSGAPAGR